MNSKKADLRVLRADSCPLIGLFSLHCLRWFVYVLYVHAHRQPFCTHFALVLLGWKMRRDGPKMTWRRDMKNLVSALTSAGSFLPNLTG